MAEEDLKKAIQERIRREKEKILKAARQEAEKILTQAKLEASSLQEANSAEIKKDYSLRKTKELNSLIQEMKSRLSEAKEKKILEVLSYVRGRLKTIHQDKDGYESIFRNLLKESYASLAKITECKLKVNPIDQHLALEVLKEFKLKVRLDIKDSIEAGLELCDLEENTIILNTFASRLEKIIPELRMEISKTLFKDLI